MVAVSVSTPSTEDTSVVEPVLLTAARAAQLLGVPPKSLYRWTSARIIPAAAVLRIGSKIRWRRAVLERWAAGELADERKRRRLRGSE